MIVIQDDIWLCVDCLMLACNGDASGIEGGNEGGKQTDEERIAECEAGLEKLGPHLVPDFDSEADEDDGIREFSWCGCDCCGSRLGGSFHRFAILGEGTDGEDGQGYIIAMFDEVPSHD